MTIKEPFISNEEKYKLFVVGTDAEKLTWLLLKTRYKIELQWLFMLADFVKSDATCSSFSPCSGLYLYDLISPSACNLEGA